MDFGFRRSILFLHRDHREAQEKVTGIRA